MVVAVISGKGGTGKTTLATNFAKVLSYTQKVQLLDADAEEPDVHLFFQVSKDYEEEVRLMLPVIDKEKCTLCGECARRCQFGALSVFNKGVMVFNNLCHGCGLCFNICPERAIVEMPKTIGRVELGKINDNLYYGMGILEIGEPSPVRIIRALKKHIDPEKVVILDSPPGTSCPVVETLRKVDYALMVTEPTPFGLHDLKLALQIVREMKIPFGVVVNRDGGAYSMIDEFAREEKIEILEKIPFKREIAKAYSNGVLFTDVLPEWKERFERLYEKILKSSEVVRCSR